MVMEVVDLIEQLAHDHPLILIKPEETDGGWDLSCRICEQPILPPSSSSYYYGCKQCQFFLHKTCGELQLPHNISHPSHSQHPLTFRPLPISRSCICDLCKRKIIRLNYRCHDCDYDIDLKCALAVLHIQQCTEHTSHDPRQLTLLQKESMFSSDACGIKDEGTSFACTTCGFWVEGADGREIAMEVVPLEHEGHYHPLMLIKTEETDPSWDLSCSGCGELISAVSSYYYGCKLCLFFLHNTCAKLPSKMTLPSHPQHPLILLLNQTSVFRDTFMTCVACNKIRNGFFYLCDVCDYGIHMKCALTVLSIQQRIGHTSHPHQLIPLQRESTFLCDACGMNHEDTSFLCTTCGFWINQNCASSPRNLKLNKHHDHTLSLFYFIPLAYYWPSLSCKICSERIYRRFWVYCCSKCHYLVHLQCALLAKESDETEGLNLANLSSRDSATATSGGDQYNSRVIRLPKPDDYSLIITQFIKDIAIQGKHKEAAEINHGSHDHPLTLFENPINHGEKCMVCAQSISAPFYGCLTCKFFLHVWCAELPDELQHPGHAQHTLFLNDCHGSKVCYCCTLNGTVLLYSCQECAFDIDCTCASLPRVIKHDSHDKHTLALKPTSVSSTCISCSAGLRLSFQCGTCKYNLCARCALLPGTFRHRYDKHPFMLTYSPPPYHTDDDFCEICEEAIDFNRWFYHCGECDRYLHKDCILPVLFSSMVYDARGTFDSREHPHRLIRTLFKTKESCRLCQRSINADSAFYFCPPCWFVLCYPCAEKEKNGEKFDEDFLS